MVASTGATCVAPAAPVDGDLSGRTDAMARMLAVALSCDQTRVFTFMLTSPASVHSFTNLGVADGMHKVCHDGVWEQVRAITRYQMECFSLMCDRLQEVNDPTGTSLMDRAVILGISEYGEGWKHSDAELPAVFVGGGAGRLARNVHTHETAGNFSKAHLTALRALGLDTEAWGWSGAETTDHVADLVLDPV
jgi:hypothetical protein